MLHAVLALAPSVILVLAGLVGMVVHFMKRRVKGETVSGFMAYYVHNYPGYTLASIAATVVGVLGLVHTGIALHDAHAFAAAFATGYMSDSALNKDGTLKTAVAALDIAEPAEPAVAAAPAAEVNDEDGTLKTAVAALDIAEPTVAAEPAAEATDAPLEAAPVPTQAPVAEQAPAEVAAAPTAGA